MNPNIAVSSVEHYARGYAPRGKTPVLVLSQSKRCRINLISAVTNQGTLRFMLYRETLDADMFIKFLKRLCKDAGKKVFLIVDNLRVHHAKLVQQWIEPRLDKIELFYLPPYAPESNPDEYLNHDFKTSLRLEPASGSEKDLLQKATRIMNRIAQWPERIRSYFQHPHAAYAA